MLDELYENIGGKIKNWAKWIFILEAVAAVITGIILCFDDMVLAGLVTIVLGPLAAWVGSWLLYGFGELIETNAETRDLTYQLLQHQKETAPKAEAPAPVKMVRESASAHGVSASRAAATKDGWVCTCGRVNEPYMSSCVCGVSKFEALTKKNKDNQ